MTNELVRATDVNIDDLGRMGRMLATSGYFERDRDLNVAIAQMAVKVMAGRELGYGPFASANGIHIIKGKPAVSANLMAAAVKAHPRYDYRVKRMDNDAVEIEFFENGKSIGVSSFTKADANAAGTQNMTKFARNMLFARAISNGVKWFCPDVFAGNAVYVPEELGAEVDGNGDVIGYTVVDQGNGNGTPTAQPDVDMADVEELDPGDVDASTEWTEASDNGTQPAQAASDGDGVAPVQAMKANTRKKLHAVGTQVYGDGWEAERHRVIKAAGLESSNDLTEEQANKWIAKMNATADEQKPRFEPAGPGEEDAQSIY